MTSCIYLLHLGVLMIRQSCSPIITCSFIGCSPVTFSVSGCGCSQHRCGEWRCSEPDDLPEELVPGPPQCHFLLRFCLPAQTEWLQTAQDESRWVTAHLPRKFRLTWVHTWLEFSQVRPAVGGWWTRSVIASACTSMCIQWKQHGRGQMECARITPS